jgi:hypothetical protein
MYNLKEFKLINFVIAMFSWMVTLLTMLPIYADITSPWAIGATIIVFVAISFVINGAIRKALDKFIEGEIERHKRKHLNEFFNYIEDDVIFNKNVLREDIPIYDDERKKVGIQTVYHALNDKKWGYINNKLS